MHGLVDPFYERSSATKEPGQIWCDQPVYLPARHGLKITRVDPKDDTKLDYAVCGRTVEIFNHPPVHSLKMASNEGAIVVKTKRDRPVILLGGGGASDFSPGKKPTHAEIIMAVPVYGADQYDEQIRRRMEIYDFANVFYLPADTALGFDEGFARLDHMQPVSEHHLSRHRGLRLADEALAVLHEWTMRLLTNSKPVDSIIEQYRSERVAEG
jgi:hypothetical protein